MFLDKTIHFENSDKLHVTKESLLSSGAKVQSFAVYVPESVHPDMQFEAALTMIDIFHEKIIKANPEIKHVQTKEEVNQLQAGEVGAFLTLEGCDAIGTDLMKLKTLLRLGVSAVGLTWNNANAVADGALEPRGGGITVFGNEVIKTLNKQKIWIDVSHLSEKGFWDVMETADHPYASHSNAYTLCPHPRNLRDDQIRALIDLNSVIGITFVPPFLSGSDFADITDVLRHLDYVCSLGGEEHVGFGSDFDGIVTTVKGLESQKAYPNLINELLKYYSASQVEKFLYTNMYSRIPK